MCALFVTVVVPREGIPENSLLQAGDELDF